MLKLFTTLILLLGTFAFAQITITHDDLPNIGAAYTLHHAEHGADVENGDPGPNQTWSFEEYIWEDEELMEIASVDESPFADDFPTATRAVFYPYESRHDEGVYYFERITMDGYFVQGFGNVTDTDTLAYPYVGEALQCPFPLSYPSTEWVTVKRWWFESVPGDTVVIVDSLRTIVDGWGTVTTPFGSFEVLRVFHHDWLFTYFPNFDPVLIQQVGYRWIDENCVVRVDVTSEADEIDPHFHHGHLHMVSDALDTPPVRGPVARTFSVKQNYPNPFNYSTQLPLTLQQGGEVTLSVYNESGQLVSEQKYSFGPGQYDLPINGSQWSTGTYFANVSLNNAAQTTKMQLVK